ncbi:MAG: hypothetical protein KBD23_02430 [Gammaproteobacteria bacterium]|nr:hypothetical protein [Gammaproteobacteria bacterium]MBP9728981.1 hypothetical protein [Gammaproteobacteria bacterium]
MVYEKERPSLEGIEFDDEREIMSQIFDGYRSNEYADDVDYLNPSLTQNGSVLNIMPEVCRVARVLLKEEHL